ncbi:MAG TPA: hypothetical protein VFO25_08010 [Candidatus Eremiobacteraceae bacterium]|nr:hypothetical protein [Candidatus Eremiobacteraceae bacterium]
MKNDPTGRLSRARVAPTDGRFLRLVGSLGTWLRWLERFEAPSHPNLEVVSIETDLLGTLPVRVERASRLEFFDAVCAAYVALRHGGPIGLVVVLPLRAPSQARATLPPLGLAAPLPVRISARAILRRIMRVYGPRFTGAYPGFRRPDIVLVQILSRTTERLPSPRDVYAARAFLRDLFERHDVALWPSAPEWLRPPIIGEPYSYRRSAP